MPRVGPVGLTVLIVATIVVIVALSACARGEDADWKGLVAALERKQSPIQGWGHRRFPDYHEDKARAQVEAMREFARKHPRSERVDRILREYLLPSLWRDVEHGGLSLGTAGSEYVCLLAWELHQLAPDRRPGFAGALEEALTEVPRSGFVLARLGEELGDEALAERGRERERLDDGAALLARRKEAIAALAGAKEPARMAMRELLRECTGARDRISIEVTGFKPGWEPVLEQVWVGLSGDLRRQAGVWSTAPDHDTKDPVRGSLVVRIGSEERPLEVVVQRTATISTSKERTLERDWSHGTQDWRYQWKERRVTTETGGGPSAETYPVLSAEFALGRPDADPLWKSDGVTSDWRWVRSADGGYAEASISKGDEVPPDVWSYTAENLSGRVMHRLLGPAFLRGLQ